MFRRYIRFHNVSSEYCILCCEVHGFFLTTTGSGHILGTVAATGICVTERVGKFVLVRYAVGAC